MNVTLTAALDYASRGWRVLPLHSVGGGACTCGKPECDSPGKHPRILEWQRGATCEERMIRSWLTKWPQANIGIATGAASGIVVLDVDPAHGGADSLRDLEAEHGPLPETPISLTGGGGAHYVLAYPVDEAEIRNSQAQLGPGLDVRGEGGFIVAPGSRHASGNTYEWDAAHDPDDVSIAPLPEWLLHRLTAAPSRNGAAPRLDTAAVLAGVPEGQRDDAIFKLVSKLRAADVPRDVAERLALEAASQCSPPFPADTALEKVASVYARYGPGKNGADPEGEEPRRIVLRAQTVEDFLQEEIEEADAIITDGGGGAILSPGEKLMLAGPPGVGKTNIGSNMAADLAAGKPVLGLPCGQGWNVLYVLLEGNRKRYQKRLRKLLRDADPETLRRFHFAHLSGLDLSQAQDALALEELCQRLEIDVLFIDPFREAHSLGEDKSEDAARIMRVLNGILSALPRLAIVLVHHVRKPDPRRLRAEQTLDQIRGSGHLVAAMQSVLLVNEDPGEPDKLLADWVKHRDAEERLAPMLLYFDRETLTYEVAERPGSVKVTPEAIVTAILSAGGYLEGPSLVSGLMEVAGAGERTVREAIRKARDLNLITEEKVSGSSKKAYRVTLEEEA